MTDLNNLVVSFDYKGTKIKIIKREGTRPDEDYVLDVYTIHNKHREHQVGLVNESLDTTVSIAMDIIDGLIITETFEGGH